MQKGLKIFLEERTVEFLPSDPGQTDQDVLVVHVQNAANLRSAWDEFKRYQKYRKLLVIADQSTESCCQTAFETFQTLFKFVRAAGGVVENELGEYLFIHRFGKWDLPKGKISRSDLRSEKAGMDDDQTARIAAEREVMEETGLSRLLVEDELSPTWHIYSAKEKDYLKMTRWFKMRADSGQPLKPQTSEGIFLVKWTNPNLIHCIMAHTYASIRELLLEVLF